MRFFFKLEIIKKYFNHFYNCKITLCHIFIGIILNYLPPFKKKHLTFCKRLFYVTVMLVYRILKKVPLIPKHFDVKQWSKERIVYTSLYVIKLVEYK